MRSQLSLRQLCPQDSRALGKLMDDSPDTGRIGTASHFEIDAFEALRAMQGDFVGVVAESPDYDGLVGACLARFGQCQFEGRLQPYALLNSLVVHPGFRGQGVGSALVGWLVNHSRNRLGDEGVIWALIQQGNVGSVQTVGKYLKQFISDRIVIVPTKTRATPPTPTPRFMVHPIGPSEFGRVADQLNSFYRDCNFYEPETAESLASWCASTPFDTPFRHYLVVTDSKGAVHAGAGVSELYRLRTLHIRHMPNTFYILNTFFRIVPSDRITKELVLSKIWLAPGRMEAAKHLFETIRWRWREKASLLIVWGDKGNPVLEALNLRPWTPVTKSTVVIDNPEAVSTSRLVYYD
jgi:GNAT superfamily N-acetyltransferase